MGFMSVFKSRPTLALFTLLTLTVISVNCRTQTTVGDGGTYKITNVFNEKFLTVAEEGIVGLKTGIVITTNDRGPHRSEQMWTLTWDPVTQEDHQGYRIQSKKDFLNDVTSYYPEGRSYAHINVWKLKHLGSNKWHLQNTRTRNCLSLREEGIEVEEEKCSTKAIQQQWSFRAVVNVPEEDDETHILATNSRFPYTNEADIFKRPRH